MLYLFVFHVKCVSQNDKNIMFGVFWILLCPLTFHRVVPYDIPYLLIAEPTPHGGIKHREVVATVAVAAATQQVDPVIPRSSADLRLILFVQEIDFN